MPAADLAAFHGISAVPAPAFPHPFVAVLDAFGVGGVAIARAQFLVAELAVCHGIATEKRHKCAIIATALAGD